MALKFGDLHERAGDECWEVHGLGLDTSTLCVQVEQSASVHESGSEEAIMVPEKIALKQYGSVIRQEHGWFIDSFEDLGCNASFPYECLLGAQIHLDENGHVQT